MRAHHKMDRKGMLGLIAVVGAIVIVSLLADNDYQLGLLFMMGVYFLCAAGMNVLVGFAGQKSLGQAGLFAAGAYGTAILSTRFDWNPVCALLGAAVLSGLCGALIAWPSLRVRGPYLAMVTLAFGIVVEKLVAGWTEVFGGAQGIYGVKPLTLSGAPLSGLQWVWLVVVFGVITYLLLRNLLTGRFGRAWLAIQADEIAAACAGVNVYRYKVLAFVIAGVCCGVAGGLVAQHGQYINSDYISFNLSIFILLLVLFGGAGSLYGPLIGAITLTLIDAYLARWPSVQHFGYGALLLFALYVMPEGVAGLLKKVSARLVRSRSSAPEVSPELSGARAALSALAKEIPAIHAGGTKPELLEVHHLAKSFGGIHPVQDVSFSLRSGKIHALIGPNGAGKTTMINMLSGVIPASSGRIAFLGKDIGQLSSHAICRQGIARTFQNLRLFGALSVQENILIGRHCRMQNGFFSALLGLPSSRAEEHQAREHTASVLDFFGLTSLALRPAGSLAYGLQRRVELARALATEPLLLLLDEPAAGLNPQECAELGDLIVSIAKLGISIVMVEHHMDLVMKISDHVIVLDHGSKIAEGLPAAVRADARVIASYLGAPVDETALAAKAEEATC
ncbi:branched-chain amino acid ABC transporter ATP-binding protein/permease [Glaciimonas sp. CA11.2]|uniref:branched-chain amino acid ABC transporter ATP-binding protein/permease n=1 Tax=Glaciimonas sp. CA11.2 TaxID=3048601 RepID=UPI002AB3EFB3|nr:branched-chain amino acid ABC transporter ATP-binding protein/permease [Glaciimonas sp. CA11.2]MDY7545243.1 branched-chain amino acid ABC transporter ATP-binding protein/permease [Glaciimonas sp. CA11.2]MEB0161620.1 branched-chain amino acid ABC transporter ATP-binding protein/permease [Glaciimonas sp. CA11.2]